jgi:SAM-dependent methyltransferase
MGLMNMNTREQDPIGQAILDFTKSKKPFDIIVKADLCDDDIIPIETLFRSFDEMPKLEQKAMQLCKGKILDVGACAGPHSRYLSDSGFNVSAIDVSPGAVLYLNEIGINAHQVDFFHFQPKEQYDTILLLMNGLGIAGTLANLERTLLKASSLLKPGGQILCDSSDVKFLYEEEDGSYWMDLNSKYYGEFKFKMSYKKIEGPWFDWLYVDYDKLHKTASNCGFKSTKIEDQEHHYLAQLILT